MINTNAFNFDFDERCKEYFILEKFPKTAAAGAHLNKFLDIFKMMYDAEGLKKLARIYDLPKIRGIDMGIVRKHITLKSRHLSAGAE